MHPHGEYRRFSEAEIKSIGGLTRRDLSHNIRELSEMCALAVEVVPSFHRCLESGRGIREWMDRTMEACSRLRESNSESTLGFLLRKGLQSEGIGYYQVAEKVWPQYCGTAGSTTVAEFYAPLYHTTLPGPVQHGDRFPVAEITGDPSLIRNIVFGQIIPIDRTLFDDDQTSQIKQYSQRMGDGMAILESVWTSSRFIGAARTYANITVPASTYSTKDTTGTAVTTPFSTALGNRPTTFAQLTLPKLARAYVSLLTITDPMNNIVVVKPNKLLVSAQDALNGDVLLKPGGWPAVIGQGDTTAANNPVLGGTSATAGTSQGVLAGYPGGWNSPNPFAGMGISLVMERYLPAWAWACWRAARASSSRPATSWKSSRRAATRAPTSTSTRSATAAASGSTPTGSAAGRASPTSATTGP